VDNVSGRIGQADVISVVVITSVIVLLVIGVFNYAVYSLEVAAQQAEFERAENAMRELALSTIDSIITGSYYEVSFPSRTAGLNFITISSELKLSIEGLKKEVIEQLIDSEILIVKCVGGQFVSKYHELLIGVEDEVFVEDLYELPLLVADWDLNRGREAFFLNFTRLLIQVYEFEDEVIIELSYIDTSWSSGVGPLNRVRVMYKSTTSTTIWSGRLRKAETITFRLYLDDRLLGEREVSVEGKIDLTVKLVVHQVQYRLG